MPRKTFWIAASCILAVIGLRPVFSSGAPPASRAERVIYSITGASRRASAAQKFSVLYDFGTKNVDPVLPTFPGIIAQGRDGNLYSTTPYATTETNGAPFVIRPSGVLTVLNTSFGGVMGSEPHSGLVLGTDGNFYGTAIYGGNNNSCSPNGCGTAFKIASTGQLTVLHSFTGGIDGANPTAPPIQGLDGDFYGTTISSIKGPGAIYKLTPNGRFTALYEFDKVHGAYPFAPLIQGEDGNFYGVTVAGGSAGLGVVFKTTAKGNLTVLYNFDGPHGSQPVGPLVQGNDGDFYGTTFDGGTNGSGVVFNITPAGELSVLHNFEGESGGFYPFGGLVLANDGNFYGTTQGGGPTDNGTIFRITPTGDYSVLYTFDGTRGSFPQVTLLQHTNGILYGDTNQGGTINICFGHGCGTFFSLNLGLPPFVSLLPISGRVGKTVEILGQRFRGTTGVSFNGTAATFKVVSSTYLIAVVPKGATTGPVTVTTPNGKLKSNRKFRILR